MVFTYLFRKYYLWNKIETFIFVKKCIFYNSTRVVIRIIKPFGWNLLSVLSIDLGYNITLIFKKHQKCLIFFNQISVKAFILKVVSEREIFTKRVSLRLFV